MAKNNFRNADPRTTAPRYVRVYTALREWIDNGKYSPGEKISSEEEIGQMFGVSRITTRKAIDLLVEDDLVYRLHGKGTYVAENVKQRAGMVNIAKRMRDARRVATRSKVDRIDISEIDADPKTCIDLKLSTGSRVLRTSYVRLFNDTPVCYAISYIPTELGMKINTNDLRANTPLSLLEKSGFDPVSAHQLISATLADALVAGILDSNLGSPIMRIKQIVMDRNQSPLERFIIYYRADKYEHPMTLHERQDLDLVHGSASNRR
jgi:GntR family transcriptional regulator